MGAQERPQDLVDKSFNVSVLPNPCAGSAVISFQLAQPDEAKCTIFNATGRKIRTLVSSRLAPGSYTLTWDRKDDTGGSVTSGVYFIRISVGHDEEQIKLVLLK